MKMGERGEGERIVGVYYFSVSDRGVCPYLSGRDSRDLYVRLPQVDSQFGAGLLAGGFRRYRDIYYRPICGHCDLCVSVRIPVAAFDFSRRSVKRLLRRNRDLRFMQAEAVADAEMYDLFCRYMGLRHRGSAILGYEEFVLLLEVGSDLSCLYKGYCGDELVGVIFVDRFGGNYSAVHSFYAAEDSGRGLGNWLIYSLLGECLVLGVDYLYLGYWVRGCDFMDYKIGYRPLEMLKNGEWQPV